MSEEMQPPTPTPPVAAPIAEVIPLGAREQRQDMLLPTLVSVEFMKESLTLAVVTPESDTMDIQAFCLPREICQVLGLDWASQYKKLINHPTLSSHIKYLGIPCGWPAAIEKQQVNRTCGLSLRGLPAWLLTLHPDRVAPQRRETLLRMQRELHDVLYQYCFQGHADYMQTWASTDTPVGPHLEKPQRFDREVFLEVLRHIQDTPSSLLNEESRHLRASAWIKASTGFDCLPSDTAKAAGLVKAVVPKPSVPTLGRVIPIGHVAVPAVDTAGLWSITRLANRYAITAGAVRALLQQLNIYQNPTYAVAAPLYSGGQPLENNGTAVVHWKYNDKALQRLAPAVAAFQKLRTANAILPKRKRQTLEALCAVAVQQSNAPATPSDPEAG